MKTILVPTDFSDNATHAAEYAYDLAKQLKAKLILCNAFIVPAEIPEAGMVIWPMDDYQHIMDDSLAELEKLSARLQSDESKDDNKPKITCVNEMGDFNGVLNQLIENRHVDMVVMGTHGRDFSKYLLGNHAKGAIDYASKPLLLIPPKVDIKPIKKIAFATDFKHPDEDLKFVYELIPFARMLDAEILITHIAKGKEHADSFKELIGPFLTDLSNKSNYAHIYYRICEGDKPDDGLNWLCVHGHVDILAMVHHSHSFLHGLLNGSVTQKMASKIEIPLLVFHSQN